MQFEELLQRHRKALGYPAYRGRILSLDPGVTTGWAVFEDLQLASHGEINTSQADKAAVDLFKDFTEDDKKPGCIVVEDYRVFHSRAKHHAGSALHTPQLIGGIKAMAHMLRIPIFTQQPSQAKGFCNDIKLKEWGFYVVGKRHARDAVRHGCYFLIFNQTWKEKINAKRNSQESKENSTQTSQNKKGKGQHVG